MHLNFNCEIEYAPTAKEPRRKMQKRLFSSCNHLHIFMSAISHWLLF